MSKNKDKKKKTPKSWESYGVAFWITMSVTSVIMAMLGLVTFSFALLRILYGDFWFMWFVLAAAGAGTFALSFFCFDLFPVWAGFVRTIRLADARIAGAMSISQINKYEEREDRRTAEVKEKVQESYSKVGKDVLVTQKHVTEIDDKISKMYQAIESYQRAASSADALKSIENSMDAMSRKLEKYTEETDRTIRKLKEHLEIIEDAKNGAVFSAAVDEEDTTPPPAVVNDNDEKEDVPKEESPKKTKKKDETKPKKERKSRKQEKAEEKAKGVFGTSKTEEDGNEDKNDGNEEKEETSQNEKEVFNDGFSEEDDDLSGMPEDYADSVNRLPFTIEEMDGILDSYYDGATDTASEADFTTTTTEESYESEENAAADADEESGGNAYTDL